MVNKARTLAIVGYGDLGARVLRRLDRARWHGVGLCRSPDKVEPPGRGVATDLTQPDSLRVLGELVPDAVLLTLTPTDRSERGYRQGFSEAMNNIIAGLAGHQPSCMMFVSSTRVYGESAGAWVQEDAELASEPRARAIIDAEASLQAYARHSIVLRAGGLYSAPPGFLLSRVAQGRFTAREPRRFGSRVHREDVARFIEACLNDAPPERASDPEPVAHKRVSNSRLRSLGFELHYPSYLEGYGDALARQLD